MPFVSIIIPCYNEERRIQSLLDAVFAQTYPQRELEIIISDGQSTDHTRAAIAEWHTRHPEINLQVVENTQRSIPAALNRAIDAARGEIILRLDGHSAPQPDYVEKSVAALQAGRGDNVGGVWEIRAGADTWMARAIAAAAAHPLGVGDALYRHAREAAQVDTVPFGCFYRALIERIGRFDETLLTNEDYEFNTRIRLAGGKVWLDPAIRSTYYARATFGALIRQYWRYGFWKLKMLQRYPRTLRWRQGLPPLLVAGILSGSVLLWIPLLRYFWWAAIAVYILTLAAAGLHAALKNKQASLLPGLPMAIMAMHLSWGAGFLWSLVSRSKMK
jgi:glycosyltransferase involved in cell wall biosynthesis